MHPNPMGLDGFLFVEFSSANPESLSSLFKTLGFTKIAEKANCIEVYQQNNIYFLLNQTPNSFAQRFANLHGASACSMGFCVKDSAVALKRALSLGAEEYQGPKTFNAPAIYGIGNSLLYLIDDYQNETFLREFKRTGDPINPSAGLLSIDHLTHNVFQGQMEVWADYYERLFNFKEIRYFDIQGQHTGLFSRALKSPCQKIRIPLNESKDDQSQIAEFLRDYKGEGIQHIALSTNDIFTTVEKLKQNGIDFLDTPDTYYELLSKRLPNHGEDVKRMQKNRILIDGGEKQGGGYLLQIFTKTVIGPIFFEIIQRKGNEGFGEGNFQALFDSIELDQIRRGVIKSHETV